MERLNSGQRVVVKVGTSVLTGGTQRLNRQRMLDIVQQTAHLHQAGHEVVLVSSGAVAAGRERLNFPDLGRSVPAKQMLSAIGQSRLMAHYSAMYDIFEIVVAQVLLTRDDLANRTRFLNARDTLLTLIDRRILPIINENDATATHEIRVGDNDNLSALVATAIEADLLIMLTDQPGLFTADPRHHRDAQLIQRVERINPETWALAGDSASGLGTGGMVTKLQAAQLATRGGVATVIAGGKEPDVLRRILAGEPIGTRFEPSSTHMEGRKRWLLVDKTHGRLDIDAGAARVLLTGGASLLPVGITRVEGEFRRGMTLSVFDPDGREIAHGMTSYDSADVRRLIGVKSMLIPEILGYSYGDAIIHRNNMVLLLDRSS
ncbi:MAG: glutamate 5-kinase [Aggregatilineales bacterium]